MDVSGRGHRAVFVTCRRLVDAVSDDGGLGFAGPADGGMETKAEEHRHDPFGSGQPIHQS